MSNKSLPLNDKNAFMIVRNALIKSISQKAISNPNDIKNVSLCLNYIAKRLNVFRIQNLVLKQLKKKMKLMINLTHTISITNIYINLLSVILLDYKRLCCSTYIIMQSSINELFKISYSFCLIFSLKVYISNYK